MTSPFPSDADLAAQLAAGPAGFVAASKGVPPGAPNLSTGLSPAGTVQVAQVAATKPFTFTVVKRDGLEEHVTLIGRLLTFADRAAIGATVSRVLAGATTEGMPEDIVEHVRNVVTCARVWPDLAPWLFQMLHDNDYLAAGLAGRLESMRVDYFLSDVPQGSGAPSKPRVVFHS